MPTPNSNSKTTKWLWWTLSSSTSQSRPPTEWSNATCWPPPPRQMRVFLPLFVFLSSPSYLVYSGTFADPLPIHSYTPVPPGRGLPLPLTLHPPHWPCLGTSLLLPSISVDGHPRGTLWIHRRHAPLGSLWTPHRLELQTAPWTPRISLVPLWPPL